MADTRAFVDEVIAVQVVMILSGAKDGWCTQVLAFPCNQFGSQEPGTCAEVKKFASTMYDADFPIFDKVRSRGRAAIPRASNTAR